MLVRYMVIEPRAIVRVGDVTLTLMKVGDRRIRVGVSAPPELKITTIDGNSHPPVDTRAQDVVGEG